jgi:hypothetical protein
MASRRLSSGRDLAYLARMRHILPALVVLVTACGGGGGTTTPPPSECPTSMGAGTEHKSSVSSDETWTVEGNPHVLPSGLDIATGATLTLGPCVVVQVAAGKSIDVSGKLVTQGTATRRVTITARDPAMPWLNLSSVRPKLRPAIDLSFTTLSNGGVTYGRPEQTSMVFLRGDDQGPLIKVNDVRLEGSANIGMLLLDEATFAPGSQALTITKSRLEPIVMTATALTDLPDGALGGNGVDEIGIANGTRIGTNGAQVSVVMNKRSVPYRIGVFGDAGGSLLVGPSVSGSARLTIRPGTTVKFAPGKGIATASVQDNASGSIVAVGTAAEPITFTSASNPPAPGDWEGLFINGAPAADTAFDHVVIDYAGMPDTTVSGYSCGAPGFSHGGKITGALRFATNKSVGTRLLSNSVIRNSGSNGVDRGWSGDQVDYLATNTFEHVSACTQTEPRSAAGTCPMSPSCPRSP